MDCCGTKYEFAAEHWGWHFIRCKGKGGLGEQSLFAKQFSRHTRFKFLLQSKPTFPLWKLQFLVGSPPITNTRSLLKQRRANSEYRFICKNKIFIKSPPSNFKKMVPCKGCFPIWKSPFSVASPPAFFTPATGTLARRAESAENADSARRCRIAKLARRAESTENADSARRRWIAMSNPAARIYFEFWTFKIENAQEEKILGNQSFNSWKSGGPG